MGEGELPLGIDEHSLLKRQGAYLPHWRQDRAVYHVVFRLADSIPAEAAKRIRDERSRLERKAALQGELAMVDAARLKKLRYHRIDELLDKGLGDCVLRDPRCAQIAFEAMLFFAGERYILHVCCVMPNHVHAVVEPFESHPLEAIVHSWKSFSSNHILRITGAAPPLWQKEPYDHILRSDASYRKCLAYVMENPTKAGLQNWDWKWSSCSTE